MPRRSLRLCVLPIVSSNVLLNQSATNLVENHEESENNFSIYPVPAEDFLIIKSKNDKLVSIRILTLTGQVVRETKLIDSNEIRIDVSQIISGIYLVELQTTIGTFIRRQIVF